MQSSRPQLCVRAAAASRRGPLHERNEDAWCIHGTTCDSHPGRGHLFAVSDGVSTAGEGDLASALTCERLGQFLDDTGPVSIDALVQLVSEIDWELRGAGRGAACTISVVWLIEGVAHVVTVGDSPVFLLRGNRVSRIGTAPRHEGRRLGAYLGMGPAVADVLRVADLPLRPGDVILLMTDGISGSVQPSTYAAEWSQAGDPDRCARALVSQAARAGVEDDATVLVVEVAAPQGAQLGVGPLDAPDPPDHLVD